MPTWLEFHITTTAQYAQLMSDQLLLLGAEAITIRDAANEPIYEPALDTTPLWQEVVIIGLFDGNEPLDQIGSYLETQRKTGLMKRFELHPIPDQDWTRRCLDSFTPLQFGKRLWVCPSWLTPPDPNAINVVLDPGLAFGTGTHPTTALCLEWLDKTIDHQELVVDYGCGSGILSIAALKLGAKNVIAIDHDPQALEATRENAYRNDIDFSQLTITSPNDLIPPVCDVLMANILANPLINFAPAFGSMVKHSGKIVLSGILNNQTEAVIDAFRPFFVLNDPVLKEEWVRLDGIRK